MLFNIYKKFMFPLILLDRIFYHSFFKFYYKKKFAYYGSNIRWGKYYLRKTIPFNIRISNVQNIYLNDGCQIDEFCHLMCSNHGKLILGKNVRLANGFIHIGAYNNIIIEDNVLIASFSQIINGNHEYRNNSLPIMQQGSFGTGDILIKSGCWIGRNSCVLGGVVLGKNSVVGANSVVTKSFDDYSIIVGQSKKIGGE